MVKPWLDPVTAAKVFFVDKGGMLPYISEEILLAEYGGNDHYKVYVVCCSAFMVSRILRARVRWGDCFCGDTY